MAGIFISYRRADSQGFAGRLGDDLEDRYGEQNVFRDVEIEPGVDFSARIADAMKRCDVLLAVIGPHWATAADAQGDRRLWDTDDWVRLEIEAGLERGIPVLPVLVGTATMPMANDLPASLTTLLRVQALSMTDRSWETDLDRLCAFIERHVPLPRRSPVAAPVPQKGLPRRWKRRLRSLARGLWWVTKKATVIALVGALVYFVLENYADASTRQFVYGFARFLRQTVESFLPAR